MTTKLVYISTIKYEAITSYHQICHSEQPQLANPQAVTSIQTKKKSVDMNTLSQQKNQGIKEKGPKERLYLAGQEFNATPIGLLFHPNQQNWTNLKGEELNLIHITPKSVIIHSLNPLSIQNRILTGRQAHIFICI